MKRRKRFDLAGVKERWPEVVAAGIVSLALAVLVVRTNTIYTLGPRAYVAEDFASNNPRVLAARIEREIVARRGEVTDRVKSASRRLVERSPMLEEPMLIGGLDALLRNDERKARELLARAVARNPRSELGRLLSLELDLRAKDVSRAVTNMTILGRLLPDVQSAFVPELARLAQDPRTSLALSATLRSDPAILAKVLYHLAEKGAGPRLLLQIAGGVPRDAPPEGAGDWREALLRSMVSRGDISAAQRLWAAFSGVKQPPENVFIYDAGFAGLRGLAPFNWSFSQSEHGAAEREKSGGVHVEYYGREPAIFATQMIALSPGRYRLGFRVEGDLKDPQQRLFWKVQCTNRENIDLLALPIYNVTFDGRVITGSFDVPPDCPAQWLKLIGEPTEFPKNESVTVRSIRIVRLSGEL